MSSLIETVYGGLPPQPLNTSAQLLHQHIASQQYPALAAGTVTESWRVCAGDGISFLLQITLPPNVAPRNIIVCGDACWRTIPEVVLQTLLSRGHALALFNRTEIAPDPTPEMAMARQAPIYAAHPERHFGAISAWAWGFQRCVDALHSMPNLAGVPICVTGHSRGGKAALLAGATDARIATTHANNAGVLGSGAYHQLGEGSETWQALVRAYPHWVGPALRDLEAAGAPLAFEQDALLSAIAPRSLLITQALDDLWANPSGTAAIVQALQKHAPSQRIALVNRAGGHAMQATDWFALFDFLDDKK